MKNIGGLWINESKNKQKYLELRPDLIRALHTVDPQTQKVLIFPNKKRPGKQDPDYSVTVVDRTKPLKPLASPQRPAAPSSAMRQPSAERPPSYPVYSNEAADDSRGRVEEQESEDFGF